MEHENSIWLTLFSGYVGFQLCMFGINRMKDKRKNHFCTVKIKGDKEEIVVRGLIDTGNGLTDPLSNKPVAILEEDIWQKMQLAKREDKYKVIPFHSIGKEHGMLEGYEIESLHIEYEEEVKEHNRVIVAVYKGKLSVKGEYRMILPPQWFML